MLSEESVLKPDRNGTVRHIVRWLVPLLMLVALAVSTLNTIRQRRSQAQMQTDPNVATVWLAGVTRGPTHTLTHGTLLQKQLNAHNIHTFGDYAVLQSRYQGDPDGIELWFDYDSYLPNHELECHRVGQTAFVDDLGQPYHGYLDLQQKLIGVYIPNYDHSAHRLTCTLHWVPRKPAAPVPVSRPMVFTVDLPPLPRQLPLASTLPQGPVSVTKNGVTITASEMTLGDSIVQTGSLTQRKLIFRLKIQGGSLANSNASDAYMLSEATLPSNSSGLVFGSNPGIVSGQRIWRRGILLQQLSPGFIGGRGRAVTPPMPAFSSNPLSLTDPYGVSLLPNTEFLTPLVTRDTLKEFKAGKGTIWVASINGAGRGTDVIRLHCDVLPTRSAPSSASAPPVSPIPFDLLLPVQTGSRSDAQPGGLRGG